MFRRHAKTLLFIVSLLVVQLGAAIIYSYYSRKAGPIYQATQQENKKRRADSLSAPMDISRLNKWDQQYEDASLDYYYSLSSNEKTEIYLAILGRDKDILVYDRLCNSASSMYTNEKDIEARKDKMISIPLEEKVKQGIIKHWKQKHLNNKFVSDIKPYAKMRGNEIRGINEPYWLVTLGPIKNVNGKVIVGWETYSGPLAARSCKYLLEKKNGKWKVIDTWGLTSIS